MQRSAAIRRKVSPARFTAYVNPGTNAAIPTRGRSKWMMRTKTTASRMSMRRHLTLTLTSDHINIARNEFLRSDVYLKMALRMNLALLLKKCMICLLLRWPYWILTNYKSSPKCPAGQPC